MLISLDWLRDYADLPVDLDVAELCHRLTLHTVEVEGYEAFGPDLDGVTLARVVRSDGGSVVLDVGSRDCSLETRWPFASGEAVAIRLDGDSASLVSARELGIELMFASPEQGPLRLGASAEWVAGERLSDLVGGGDTVLEIDNKSLTNRPDLWCHAGLARELAAIYGVGFNEPSGEPPTAPRVDDLVGAVDTTFCRRLSAIRLRRHRDAERHAPLEIRSRLARVGQRSVNFYTDLTNYVMFAVGQPCHAFDAQSLKGPISARRSKGGELAVLSGRTLDVPSGLPVIADDVNELAVAGVVGGVDSASSLHSETLVIEMATFDALAIRESSLELGERTDASSRFEKSIDTQAIDRGRWLFMQLVAQHDRHSNIEGFADEVIEETAGEKIRTSLEFLSSRIGVDLDAARVRDLLHPLGIAVSSVGDDLLFETPTWRSTGDLEIPHDILEEVGRLVGYDGLPVSNPLVELRPPRVDPLLEVQRRAREFLAFRCHAQEVLTYPWAVDRWLAATGFGVDGHLRIEGAPSEDRASLRPSLVPNLLGGVETNLQHLQEFALFEVGTVYSSDPSTKESADSLPELRQCVGAAFVGRDLSAVFRKASGAATGLGRAVRADWRLSAPTIASWGDESVARSIVAPDGSGLGRLAAVDLDVALGVRDGRALAIFEIDITRVSPASSRENTYDSVSQFPSSAVDLSVVVPASTLWADVDQSLGQLDSPILRSVDFVDEFRGDAIGAGKKSLTLRLQLSAPDRTLTASDKEDIVESALRVLEASLGASIRQ